MKKLIVGLILLLMFVNVSYAEVNTLPLNQIDNSQNEEYTFKVSRKKLWLSVLAIGFLEGVLSTAVSFLFMNVNETGEENKKTAIVKYLINGITFWASEILMFGRQNDAGVKGLRRFNPFTNIKIAFCKTA